MTCDARLGCRLVLVEFHAEFKLLELVNRAD